MQHFSAFRLLLVAGLALGLTAERYADAAVSSNAGVVVTTSASQNTLAAQVLPPIPNWDKWFWEQILKRYDRNGDGVLDNREWQEFWDDLQGDKQGDPNYLWIDKEEFIDWAMRVLGLTREEALLLWQEFLGTMGPDANGDGRISPQEWRDWVRRTRPPSTYPKYSVGVAGFEAAISIENTVSTKTFD